MPLPSWPVSRELLAVPVWVPSSGTTERGLSGGSVSFRVSWVWCGAETLILRPCRSPQTGVGCEKADGHFSKLTLCFLVVVEGEVEAGGPAKTQGGGLALGSGGGEEGSSSGRF